MVLNVHSRELPVPAAAVGPLLDRVGSRDDPLWPSPPWPPMVMSGPLAVGVAAGHGPIRYHVTRYEPGRLIEFTFTPDVGLRGMHTLSVEPAGADRCVVQHVLQGRLVGGMVLAWPLAVRWAHDAVVEQLMDRVAVALGVPPGPSVHWSPGARLLRRAAGLRPGAAA